MMMRKNESKRRNQKFPILIRNRNRLEENLVGTMGPLVREQVTVRGGQPRKSLRKENP